MRGTAQNGYVFLTGATGFLGHQLLAELLRRGSRVMVLLRPPRHVSFNRLASLLRELGLDADEQVAASNLVVLEGDLQSDLPDTGGRLITSIVHVAAATNFRANAGGDPARTNISGTRRLLEWATRWGVGDVHLVSSAYSCGRAAGPVAEAFNPDPPPFHNDYEHSKWEAERRGVEWAKEPERIITIYRPSIIVGEFVSGRACKFGGFYLSARATELLERMHRDAPADVRRSIPLRISGRPEDCQNIVPVDYVAGMMAAIIRRQDRHGRVYHLVHPRPPSNLEIKDAFEHYFDIGGGTFVDPAEFSLDRANEHERAFYDISRPIEHYFTDSPCFLRDHTAQIEREERIACPTYDTEAISRLIRYAQASGWGKREAATVESSSDCAAYFESYLPARVSKSKIAAMTALTATVRFIIEDEADGEWTCLFDRGSLSRVHRGRNGIREDFGYKTTRDVFFEAITGRVHPQEFFLAGRAEVFGDVERALKMAMILHAFTNEFPCDRRRLAEPAEPMCSRT